MGVFNSCVTAERNARRRWRMPSRYYSFSSDIEEGVSLAQGTSILQKTLGPAYRVETPDRRGAQLERLISNFVAGFNITSGFALGIGTFLIFNAFSVSVNRRRRDIGGWRLLVVCVS